jgi:hypothetical protein
MYFFSCFLISYHLYFRGGDKLIFLDAVGLVGRLVFFFCIVLCYLNRCGCGFLFNES